MSTAILVLSILLAVVFAGSGLTKLAGVAAMRTNAERLNFPYLAWRGIGLLEVLGAAGLLVGLAVTPLGVAAAIGLLLLMIGATVAHLIHKDSASHTLPAAVLALLAAALLVLSVL